MAHFRVPFSKLHRERASAAGPSLAAQKIIRDRAIAACATVCTETSRERERINMRRRQLASQGQSKGIGWGTW